MAKTYHITTMGCQMNDYDSDCLGRTLREAGYEAASLPEGADLVLINTCAVREKAEHKAISLLGRMASLKRKHPEMLLGVMGCVAQKRAQGLLEDHPELDFVLGTRALGRFAEILAALEKGERRIAATGILEDPPPVPLNKGFFRNQVKGFVTIMEGCDNFCSYCVVPYVRGREASRSPDAILREVKYLLEEGVKEITLLGQNVNSYLYNGSKPTTFPHLLRMLQDIEGLRRIRFTTSHPKDLSDALIGCFRDLDKLCSHVHLPFQAGSDRVLQAMNRGYTRKQYMALVEKLRAARADMAVTSDVMVGFPGETAEDFQFTLDLMDQVRFDGLYSFCYSDRKGTVAETMNSKVPEKEKRIRLMELQKVQKAITLEKNRQMLDRTEEVLAEGMSRKGNQVTGRTSSNKIVNFIPDINAIGCFYKVRISRAYANSLWAEEACLCK